MRLAEQMYLAELLDFYGGCLTKNQYDIVRRYVDYNATLEEIAGQNGITRQAVGDVLRRSKAKLEAFEGQLGLVGKYHGILAKVESVASSIAQDRSQARRIAHEFTQLFKTLED